MSNEIFRTRVINTIKGAIQEAQDASQIDHPGLVGRVRELALEHLIVPMLPTGFEVGTGKLVDNQGNQSAETDLVIYNRAVLPPIMHSSRDGVFPVESTFYAIEVKSRITAAEVQDSIQKGRSITTLSFQSRITLMLFAFESDLSESSSELERYARYDTNWSSDPVFHVICVVGRGYWYHESPSNDWIFHQPSEDHDEVIDLISGIVNSLVSRPVPLATLGSYLMLERTAVRIPPPP